MGIGVKNFKFSTRPNDCTAALHLNAENFEAQQGVYIGPLGIIGCGNNHRALCVDMLVAVIADLIGQYLTGLHSGKQIDALRPVFRRANGYYAQSETAAERHGILSAPDPLEDAIHQRSAITKVTAS